MRITFILPGIITRPTGGSKIVFEYMNRLLDRRDDIVATICFLTNPNANRMGKIPLPSPAKRAVNKARVRLHPRWFPLDPRVNKRCIFSIDDDSVPDGDWVFATAVTTARGVSRLSAAKGRKGYLIQDYETWEMDAVQVEETYRLGMTNITVSHWLKGIVDEVTGGDCICIPNPVDTGVFFPDRSVARDSSTVAVLYHKGAHKGFKFAWSAILETKMHVTDLRVKMFGVYDPPQDLPQWVEYTKCATTEQLLDIYRTSTVFVCASVNEGYGLTCVEAMACGCALVTTDFPGSREYARPNVNALVSKVGDTESMAQSIVEVLTDPILREGLGNEGVKTAKELSWEKALDQFQGVLGIRTARSPH